VRWSLVLLVGSASGCIFEGWGDPAFTLSTPTCSAEVPDLARDLTYHLLQGEAAGTFAYFPGGSQLIRIQGTYDLASGDFAWVETGNGQSWIDEIAVEGFGYANRNGDLDIVGTRRLLDVLGVQDTQQFRIERRGCATENRLRFRSGGIERESVETGIYLPGRYAYTQRTDLGNGVYEVTGERTVDRTFTEDIRLDQEGYTLRATRVGDLGEGTNTRTFAESFQQGATREGTESRFTDGGRQVNFSQTTNQGTTVWSYTVDYAGNGAGTVTGAGLSCTLSFERGQCTYDCGGQRGAC
jgi:hypothetical protein